MARTAPTPDEIALALPAIADPRGRRTRSLGIALSMGWIALPISDLLSSGPPWWRALAVLSGVAGFVLLYFGGALRMGDISDRARALILVGLAAIATTLTLADRSSWALLFVFVAAGTGVRMPTRRGAWAIVAITALCAGTSALAGAPEGQLTSLTATTLAIGFMMMSFGRLIRSNLELAAARAAVARLAVAGERERFARDLHDLLGHSLSVIALKAELAGRLLPHQPQEAADHVAELEGVARDALAEVREAVSGYRQPTLAGELAGARMALEAAGIATQVRAPEAELPADVEAVLAWAVREGTTNVIRHSGARHCTIALAGGADDASGASVEISDDGHGTGGGAANGGNGLAGLRERAAQLAGHVEADARHDGFRLRVTVPSATRDAAPA